MAWVEGARLPESQAAAHRSAPHLAQRSSIQRTEPTLRSSSSHAVSASGPAVHRPPGVRADCPSSSLPTRSMSASQPGALQRRRRRSSREFTAIPELNTITIRNTKRGNDPEPSSYVYRRSLGR